MPAGGVGCLIGEAYRGRGRGRKELQQSGKLV